MTVTVSKSLNAVNLKLVESEQEVHEHIFHPTFVSDAPEMMS